ncbi:ABC transporter-like protein [Parathielavia hyrcaniae]|uniref:ABC transporter-like protein n=1 Tax=Parathielavia hyrcaniae TaxID=113614 RepID=A0AAN6T703_9PEZI|nr:ABC transporter-like protein [Parathielavia hyrcaniae]
MEPPLEKGGSEPSLSTAQSVLRTAQLLYPVVLLLSFVVSAAIHTIVTSKTEEELVVPTIKGPGGKPLPVTKRKREQQALEAHGDSRGSGGFAWASSLYLTGAVVASFVANGAAIALHAMKSSRDADADGVWWCGEERIVYVVGSAFLSLYVLITLLEWRQSPIVVHLIFWVLGLVGEVIILLASVLAITAEDYVARLATDADNGLEPWDVVDLCIGGVRVCLILSLIGMYAAISRRRLGERRLADEEAHQSDSDETSPLLSADGDFHGHANGHATRNAHYGSTNDAPRRDPKGCGDQGGCQQKEDEAAFYRPDKLPHKSWFEYCRGYSVFFPYLWPSRSARLQGVVLLCFILVVLQRIVNILVPTQLGVLTNTFESRDVDKVWLELGLLILYKLLQGPSGLLGSIRSILWIPVSQHTYRALTTAAFEHVHSLSLDFHLGKRTGEVLSALNKGASINQFLEQVTFQVVPMLVDLLVAIIYFYVRFGAMYSLFVSIITFYYLYLTIRMGATRADQRRDMVNADREEEAVKNDSIMSYETVKYFNAETREFERYGNAIKNFQEAEAKVTYGINYMNMCQSVVFMCGLLVTLLTCGYQVSRGQRRVGDFVALVTYLNQLQGPLNFFGTFYRTVQSAMISGERLLELFKIQPTVVDKPGVQPLRECSGHIKWNDVGFSYDRRRTALHDLSFECKPGTTTAFVGESGGGKSTVFRLMFRYYNCREGSIEIDGHDVKDLTIDSVRRFIGVVPQDTILFNESLMYNLKYANPKASTDDVHNACRAAAIHDRIMSFPDGYDTKVGERGLRLSGGEKQRVAIARTILKNPKIIMLDEATSALDGETEQKIQSKLISGRFGQDRTLLIIAHRLSTITHADQIIVLHAGTVVERGTHQELLALNGRYSAMWEKHCRAERAAEHARDATRKAKKLLSQANIGDGYNSICSSTILPTAPHSPTTTAADSGDAGDGHETASISSRGSSSSSNSSSSGRSDGTLHNNNNNHNTPDTARRPPLYSFPSASTAGRSMDAHGYS